MECEGYCPRRLSFYKYKDLARSSAPATMKVPLAPVYEATDTAGFDKEIYSAHRFILSWTQLDGRAKRCCCYSQSCIFGSTLTPLTLQPHSVTADRVYREALSRQTRVRGENHTFTMFVQECIAKNYLDSGVYIKEIEAEKIYRKCLKIYEEVHGKDSKHSMVRTAWGAKQRREQRRSVITSGSRSPLRLASLNFDVAFPSIPPFQLTSATLLRSLQNVARSMAVLLHGKMGTRRKGLLKHITKYPFLRQVGSWGV